MFTIDDFAIYQFDKNKFYIVLCDPNKIRFEDLAKLDWPENDETEVIFVACEKPKESTAQLTFDNIRDINNWIEEMENK